MNIALIAIQVFGFIALMSPLSRVATAPIMLVSLIPILFIVAMNIAHSFGFTLFNSFKLLARFGIDHGYALIVSAALAVSAVLYNLRLPEIAMPYRILALVVLASAYSFGALRFMFVQ